MVEKCPKCEFKYARYPLKDEQGNIIWKNLFKMDWHSVMWIIVIALLIFGYKSGMQKCDEVIEQPCEFCAKSKCCNYIQDGIFDSSLMQDNNITPYLINPINLTIPE